jgi:Prohead core protein serine protease
MAKLITEDHYDTQIITEGSGSGKKYYVKGVAAVSGVKNRNNRIYGEALLDKAFSEYLRENPMEHGRAVGELGHSTLPKVDEARISHRFVECRKKGPVYEAKALVLNTPMGNILKGLLEGGVATGFSTKGTGELRPNHQGINEVANYQLCSIADCVHEPSAPGAWVNGILENVEFYYNNATSAYEAEQYENMHRQLKRTRVANLTEEEKAEMFADFCRLIKY